MRSAGVRPVFRHLALLLAVGVTGCSPEQPKVDTVPEPTPAGSLAERSTLFEGTVPCSDCPGIRYQLLLRPDSVFFLRRSYLGADIVDQDDVGRWHLDSAQHMVRLSGNDDDRHEFRVMSPDSLTLVSPEVAHAIIGSSAALVRREESAPFEPRLRMRGMFTYMADAALFRECASEWLIPVATDGEYLKLERAYTETVKEPGSPLLAEFLGRITTRPATDREGFEDAVVVELFDGVWPGETCGARGASASLENTFWGLVRMGSQPVRPSPDQHEVHLRFVPGTGEVRGFAGCNSFSGSFRAEGHRLTFGGLSSTRMTCPYQAQETEFFERLSRVTRHVIMGDHLELYDKDSRVLLRFEARYFR